MRSSGFEILNFRQQMNYNRSTNAEYTTETAISYTACYAQYGLFSTNMKRLLIFIFLVSFSSKAQSVYVIGSMGMTPTINALTSTNR